MSLKRKRIFGRQGRHRRRVGFALAAAAAIALTSCAPESAYYQASENPKQVRVDYVRFDHTVAFDPRARGLDDEERARLDEFLEHVDPRYGDQILIGTGAGSGTLGENELAVERVAAVAEYLRAQGLKVGNMSSASRARWDGAVRIMVGRYVATPPNCPDWTKSASYDPLNVVSSNFGCATATNLGLMVADPGDLVRGRSAGPADGAYSARMIKTYREGQKASGNSPVTIMTGGSGGQGGGGGGAGGSGGGAPQ